MPACWQAWRIVVPAATSSSCPSIVTLGIARPHSSMIALKTAFPAKAGTHRSGVRAAEKWVPAFAGNAELACPCPLFALLRRLALRGSAVFSDAALHFRAEMANEALHRPDRPVGQRADRVTLDLARHFLQHVEFSDGRVARDHPLHHPPHPAEPLSARRALATAFVFVEGREARDRAHDVGRFVHDDQSRGAEPRLLGDEAVEIHQHLVADRRGQAWRRRAARDHRHQIVPTAAHAASMALDEFPHRDRHFLFDVARALDVARDAEDLGAGVARPADAGEPRGAALQDRRRYRDRLDVVDRGRAAVKPDRRRERRFKPRLALLALEAFEEPGFLAADIGAGAAVHVDVNIIARAAGVLANEPRRIGFVDRRLEALCLIVEFAADVDVGGLHPHPEAGQNAALDQLVRVVAQDVAVLAGAGFALVGVDHEVARPVALLRHERPFEPGREAGATTPAQPGFLALVDDPVAALLDDGLGAVPVAALARAGEPPVVLAVEIGEDAVAISQHRSSLPPLLFDAASVPRVLRDAPCGRSSG